MVEWRKNWLPFFICILLLAGNPALLIGQETKVFTTDDFDLIGNVKSCLVLTDYGREEFDFNREGLLTKSVTRYNDKDYSITYYKYDNGFLSERRDEVYRDGSFDENSSIAHFFARDSTSVNTITEQIVSYSKEFIDSYEYFFDEDGRLVRTIRSGTDGVDETRVEYSQYKGETTISYFLNEVLQKTIRESEKKGKDGKMQRIVLTKEFIDGVPDEALEAVYNSGSQLVSETYFQYDKKEKSFVPSKKITYQYEEHGVHSTVKTQEGLQNRTDNFIYQFDTTGNWIKQIITPSNSYTTRKITYYPTNNTEAETPGNK
jgi:hypothetical protein